MKITQTQLADQIAKAVSAAVKGRTRTTLTKDARRSAGTPDVELGDVRHYSICKYLTGVKTHNWADAENEERLYKALGADSSTLGGVLIPEQIASGVIECLGAKAVVRNMPGVLLQELPAGKLQMPCVDNAPEVTWGSENTAISEDTAMTFGRVTLEAKKQVTLYKGSRELFAWATPSADEIVQSELAKAAARDEDSVFLEGTGGVKPLGIYYNPRIVSTDLSAAIAWDNVLDMIYNIRLLNSEVNGFVMHPRTVNDLCQKKDAEGAYLMGPNTADRISRNPNAVTAFWGLPVMQTTQVAITGMPSSNESYIIAGNFEDFVIGEAGGLRIDTSTDADTAFAADQVWIKLVRHIGCALRHPESFGKIAGIQAG